MLKCSELFDVFRRNGLTFFSGVPDSTFKDWMKFLDDENGRGLTNIIAVNECEAAAVCAGYHLATGKIGVTYMQNSGLGKTVNPFTSLLDKEVYSIPSIFMIGWRGEPGKKDEPQHKKMGRITLSLLDTLEIPYSIMPDNIIEAEKIISEAKSRAEKENRTLALIIKEGIFEEYKSAKNLSKKYDMSREDAVKAVIDSIGLEDAVVSTTGKTSRELFEYRVFKKQPNEDFYTVGSMGCASSIANAIAIQKPEKRVFIFDGDGAALMQLGSFATIGHYKPKNLHHIIFDNSSHDSTGGQPTVSNTLDFERVALACGYKSASTVSGRAELIEEINKLRNSEGPSMTVVKVNSGARKDLGRPTKSPIENKQAFMDKLRA